MNTEAWIFLVVVGFSVAEDSSHETELWEDWVPWSPYDIFPTLPIAAPFSEDEKCREDSRRLIMHLKNQTLWAMQMWDSSSTDAFGVLNGNKYLLGSYDECLAVTSPILAHYCYTTITATVHRKDAFEGDFYEINPDPNATVWRKIQNSRRDKTQYPRDESLWGLCVPKSCNSTEMEKAINLYLSKLNERLLQTNGTTYKSEFSSRACSDGTEEKFSYGEIGFWVFTWLILILVGVATSIDLARKKQLVLEESKLKGYLMNFSLKRNVLTLMDRDEGGREVETSIIYGIRFYNVCYIVTDHRMGVLLSTFIFNSQRFEEDFRTWLNILLPHGDLLVDTYFFIGGYLAALNLLDMYKRHFYNPIRLALHRICRNLKRIMVTEDNPDIEHLKFLHGIRFTSIGLIVIDHHVAIFITSAMFDRQSAELALRSFQNLFLPHGDLLVDTFFFISGFLVTYMSSVMLQKQRINIFVAIIHRLFRLAPLYFYIIWFQSSALMRFGSGPGWEYRLRDEVDYCQKNWWSNLLFIQNYVNPKEMCMLHAWYLPCDLHFFIVTILLIMLIRKNKKVGSYVLHILTIMAILTPGIVTYIHDLQPMISFNPKFVDKPRLDPSFEYLYVKSHTRAAVYLMGILTAYHLYERRESTWKISKLTSVLMCLTGMALLFAPMAYGSLFYNPKKKHNLVEAVIFSVLRRFSWGLGWVLFMVVNRFGVIPIFGKVFTWKISVPLSKITYAVYLIHFILQIADESKVRIPIQFFSFDMFVKGTNDLFFSTGYALVLYLVIELPFRLIFKELLFSKVNKNLQKINAEGNNLPDKLSPNQIFTVKL